MKDEDRLQRIHEAATKLSEALEGHLKREEELHSGIYRKHTTENEVRELNKQIHDIISELWTEECTLRV